MVVKDDFGDNFEEFNVPLFYQFCDFNNLVTSLKNETLPLFFLVTNPSRSIVKFS